MSTSEPTSALERYDDAIETARNHFHTPDVGAALYHLGRAADVAERQHRRALDDDATAETWRRRRAWAEQLAQSVHTRVSNEQTEIWRHDASGEIVRSVSTPRAERLELLIDDEETVEWQDVSGQEYCLCGSGADFQSLDSGWRRECPECSLVLNHVVTDE
jgi:hypothetical protein